MTDPRVALEALVEEWRANVPERFGAGYGDWRQGRIDCAAELAATLSGSSAGATCRICQQPFDKHCQFDEPGFDHADYCELLHHEFKPADPPAVLPHPPERQTQLSFDELKATNKLRCEMAFHSVEAWTPWEWSNAMAGECGEACNVTKKMNRIWPANQFKQCWNKPEDQRMAELEQKLADEIADVVIYADLLATRIGRSLGECVRHKFNEKSDEIGSHVKLAAPSSGIAVPPPKTPDELAYWSKALELCADDLAACSLERFEEKRDKIVAILRNAAFSYHRPEATSAPLAPSSRSELVVKWRRLADASVAPFASGAPISRRLQTTAEVFRLCADELEAASAPLAPSEDLRWQPIDTAPKHNETPILVIEQYGWCCVAQWVRDCWRPWVPGGRIQCEPTHWMPLPDPPVLAALDRGDTK